MINMRPWRHWTTDRTTVCYVVWGPCLSRHCDSCSLCVFSPPGLEGGTETCYIPCCHCDESNRSFSLGRMCLPWRLFLQRSSADKQPSILVRKSGEHWSHPVSSPSEGGRPFDSSLFLTGTIGHVAHGKSTVVKAISGVHTVRFKNELERNITIKLGYANAKVSS